MQEKELTELLANGFPSKSELRRFAAEPSQPGFIKEVKSHYEMAPEKMLRRVRGGASIGAEVYEPTDFMLYFFPYVKDNLYVYPAGYLGECQGCGIGKPILIIPKDALSKLVSLMRNRKAEPVVDLRFLPSEQRHSRDFSEKLAMRIVDQSIQANVNLIPYISGLLNTAKPH